MGQYSLECHCDDYLDCSTCLHTEIIRLNLSKIEDEIECFEGREERRRDRENEKEKLVKDKKKREKKKAKKDRKKDKKKKKK